MELHELSEEKLCNLKPGLLLRNVFDYQLIAFPFNEHELNKKKLDGISLDDYRINIPSNAIVMYIDLEDYYHLKIIYKAKICWFFFYHKDDIALEIV